MEIVAIGQCAETRVTNWCPDGAWGSVAGRAAVGRIAERSPTTPSSVRRDNAAAAGTYPPSRRCMWGFGTSITISCPRCARLPTPDASPGRPWQCRPPNRAIFPAHARMRSAPLCRGNACMPCGPATLSMFILEPAVTTLSSVVEELVHHHEHCYPPPGRKLPGRPGPQNRSFFWCMAMASK